MQDDDDVDSRTMVRYSGSSVEETLKPGDEATLVNPVTSSHDFIEQGTMGTLSTDLGTMVINSDNEEEDDSTMKSKFEMYLLFGNNKKLKSLRLSTCIDKNDLRRGLFIVKWKT